MMGTEKKKNTFSDWMQLYFIFEQQKFQIFKGEISACFCVVGGPF